MNEDESIQNVEPPPFQPKFSRTSTNLDGMELFGEGVHCDCGEIVSENKISSHYHNCDAMCSRYRTLFELINTEVTKNSHSLQDWENLRLIIGFFEVHIGKMISKERKRPRQFRTSPKKSEIGNGASHYLERKPSPQKRQKEDVEIEIEPSTEASELGCPLCKRGIDDSDFMK